MTDRNKETITAVVLLLLALAALAPAGLASTPVLSVTDYKVVPYLTGAGATASSPLMPGDSGTVVVTITNTLKAAVGGNTTVHSDSVSSIYYTGTAAHADMTQTTSDQKSSVEAPSGTAAVRFVNLAADGPIQVLTGPYTDTGVLGAADSARFEFGIKADKGAADGTYQLTLTVKTADDGVYLNYPIRVQVDHTEPMLILSSYAGEFNGTENEMSLDVANPRKAAIEAVSVKAAGDEFVFEPQEYFVGTLNAGDTYTADFRVDSVKATYNTTPRFSMVYRNGDNWHSTAPMTAIAHTHPVDKGYWENVWDNWWPHIVVGVLCLLALVIFVRVIVPAMRKRGH